MKPKQIDLVKNCLKVDGEVSRNFCLGERITRLSGLIWQLRREHWQIGEGYYRPKNGGKDFVYPLISEPPTEIIGVSREEMKYVDKKFVLS